MMYRGSELVQKILYFDVETTGTDPKKNAVFQISGLIEVAGEVRQEFNFFCQPPEGCEISSKALEVTGKTVDDLQSYPLPAEVYNKLTFAMSFFVDKYNSKDKFYPCAYNGYFDLQFLQQFFIQNGDQYFGSWQNWQLIDPLPMIRMLSYAGVISLPDHKLGTVANYFGIKIDAHDAMSDIRATRELVQLLKTEFSNLDLKGKYGKEDLPF